MSRQARKSKDLVPVISVEPVKEQAFGGGLEGAQSTSRETAMWSPSFGSPDQIVNSVKDVADARSQDMVQNDGYAAGAAALHRDNIVGPQYRLNAQPNWVMLGQSESWAEQFQLVAESRFNTIGESQECWLDASRRNSFSGQIRLGINSFVMSGEAVATAEWVREKRRPFNTAIQLISPSRVNNPDGVADDRYLRRGIRIDSNGKPLIACIQKAFPSDYYADSKAFEWAEVPFEKPWGRKQVLHVMEQLLPSQNRGIADMVAVLKQMRMTKKFQELTLQNAVINASFAASIESDLPTAQVFEAIGANTAQGPMETLNNYLAGYMESLNAYLSGGKNIAIDGAKIPHLFPGTKMNMQPMGTPGGVGTGFEESLLRHVAASLGLSYEEFSRDYTKTNYSSARASMNNTHKSMQSKKRMVADKIANFIYALWLEEDINLGNIPLPKGKTADWFYEPLVKDALVQATWIGASRGQIDEKKETEAAILRIQSGLSTYEKECGRLGEDYREVFAQRARENGIMTNKGLQFSFAGAQLGEAPEEPTNDQNDKLDDETSTGAAQ